MRKKLFLLMILLMVVLVSCVPGADSQDGMMEEQMDGKATVEGVPITGGDVMMDKTTTVETMDEELMAASGTPEMMEKTNDPMMTTGTPHAGMMVEKGTMMGAPSWYSTELTDVGTGGAFRFEDFKGKVVLVETFAQWCQTCLRQQKEFVRLHEILGMPDDLVVVSLDVDPNEDAVMLREYLEKHGFDWRFAIAPSETIREIGHLYGQQFLNPPSAPVLLIDRQGKVHPLPSGVKSVEDLEEAMKSFLEEGM